MAKIVIIGLGHVGLSYLEKLVFDKSISGEVVLIDKDVEKLKGEILDLEQGMTLIDSSLTIKIGNYQALNDADICVLALGLPQSKKSRLEDLAGASKMVKEVTDSIAETSFSGVILVATNPVDVISQLTATYLSYPYQKVIGTGTMLDTIRLKSLISKKISISSNDINLYVLGEHGNSQFVYYNNANIAMSSLKNYLTKEEKDEFSSITKKMGGMIVSSKGYTSHGIGCCLLELTKVILNDEKKIYPVSNYQSDYDLYFSMPAVIGKEGIIKQIPVKLNEEEEKQLVMVTKVLRQAVDEVLPPELY